MTYDALADNILEDVRTQQVWPGKSDTQAKVLLLRYIFAAALVLARQLRLSMYKERLKTLQLGEVEYNKHPIFGLPADYFFIRADAGILSVTVDETDRQTPIDFVTYAAIRESADNPYQKGNTLVHVDPSSGRLYLVGGYGVNIRYLPMFDEPTQSNYQSLTVPVPPGHHEQLVQLVSMHIEAIRTGDRNKSAVHRALSEFYGSVAAQ